MGRAVTAKRKSRTAVTAKSLGFVDGVKLSGSFRNTRTTFKTVSDIVLGFYIAGGGKFPTAIAPIYRADVWVKGKGGGVFSSYEIGGYYNEARSGGEIDPAGDALAQAASTCIGALQRHAGACPAPTKGRKR
jgi:hypothetical protein